MRPNRAPARPVERFAGDTIGGSIELATVSGLSALYRSSARQTRRIASRRVRDRPGLYARSRIWSRPIGLAQAVTTAAGLTALLWSPYVVGGGLETALNDGIGDVAAGHVSLSEGLLAGSIPRKKKPFRFSRDRPR